MMTVPPEFAARIDVIVGKLKSIALIASNLSAARRTRFIAQCRAKIQHGADLAIDALKKFIAAMSRSGAGNA